MPNINDVDITEPVKWGFANILYKDEKNIIIHELRSHAIMISMDDMHKFIEQIHKLKLYEYSLFSVKQKECADILAEKYHKPFQFACYQAVYTKNEAIEYKLPLNTQIHLIESKDKETIYKNYQLMDHQYIDDKIANKHLWGLYEENQLAGFIGIHNEGTMGMLEVLPDYRRKGYGLLLESFLINEFLKRKMIPFCQVEENNQISLSLQRKLGLEISDTLTYWLF